MRLALSRSLARKFGREKERALCSGKVRGTKEAELEERSRGPKSACKNVYTTTGMALALGG